jgi:predicted RNase H-like nuclease (RuvC/YqgF family)
MTLDEALARADRLCPPNHPSGKRVLYTVDSRKRIPIADRTQQLDSADALGALAAEVRRLQELYARLLKANADLTAELERADDVRVELKKRSRAARARRPRSNQTAAEAAAFESAAAELERALKGAP